MCANYSPDDHDVKLDGLNDKPESPTLSISIPPTLNPSAPNVHTQAKSRRKHKGYAYVLEATDQETEKNNTLALEADDGSRPKRNRKEKHVMDI
ncbi:unnamed protein product [Porites evermanni]|uniref:Uncharacterized protein n=1 Tax=Porites evermanni TaxID=104178 RepID=A0ABN8T127_9CNID|nr:unnamed protein product [Porites evermanni]